MLWLWFQEVIMVYRLRARAWVFLYSFLSVILCGLCSHRRS